MEETNHTVTWVRWREQLTAYADEATRLKQLAGM
jgi:hypothetical protein